jgi:hypothetical protein
MPARFVRDFAVLDRPLPEVVSIIRDPEVAWLVPLATSAPESDDALPVRLGPRDGQVFSKQYTIQVGEVEEIRDGLVIPTIWKATSTPRLFPTMEADLLMSPFGGTQTYLSLEGRYRRPLGVIGEQVDDLLLHRLAERSIRYFLQQVAANLETFQVRE